MTPATVIPGVVARWTTRACPAPGTVCDECGSALHDTTCAGCGQLAGRSVGMLATVVDTPAGPQLAIAQRTEDGDWTPVRRGPASPEAVRMLARPGATGPRARTTSVGGLW